MKLLIDIETNSLTNPSRIWCVVCKDIDTGDYHVFKDPTSYPDVKLSLLALLSRVDMLVGHNILAFDCKVLQLLLEAQFEVSRTCDTFIVSKLADYSRVDGHSIEAYGQEFGLGKIDFSDFSQWSQELEDYCKRDVDICHLVYNKYLPFIKSYPDAVLLEHQFQLIALQLNEKGFAFNTEKAEDLLGKVKENLDALDGDILRQFPPHLKPIREITPKLTKYGTLNRSDFRWVKDGDLSVYSEGAPFIRCKWESFNPSSHKQIVDVLSRSGWKPVDKTNTHKELDRDFSRLKFNGHRTSEEDQRLDTIKGRLDFLSKYGWKINENNLSTLPLDAPQPARTLAKRILYESRRRTLTEWLNLVTPESRIHGEFQSIGAWTHRMSHQKPNMANIPNSTKEDGSVKLLGKELRSCWKAPKKRLLVGVDAEGIQLRVFAHYINDKEFTQSIINGRKENKTDPHSLNRTILGEACKSRQAAKRFIYALLLGAGIGKLSEVLEADKQKTEEALSRLLKRYQGFDYLKREVIPSDAQRGYFIGFDGRRVPIPGDTPGERKHLCMSGYLQNGEAIIIKRAACHFVNELPKYNAFLVDIVHDEYQIEVPNDMKIALQVAELVSDSIRWAGEYYKLNCPMAGSYWNDDKKDYTIGTNWYTTH